MCKSLWFGALIASSLYGCGFIGVPAEKLPDSYMLAPAITRIERPIDGAVSVVLSYPAQIDADIRQGVSRRYADIAFGSEGDFEEWPEAFDYMLLNTSFYIRDFYRAIKARFPEGQVVLQPAKLTVDKNGELVYQIPSQELPAVVRVDFMAYNTPRRMALPVDGQTFGPYVTPLVAITTSPEASPKTNGALSGMDRLPIPSAGNEQPSVLLQILKKPQWKPDGSIPKSEGRPAKVNFYNTTPFVEWKIEEGEWIDFTMKPLNSNTPASRVFAPYANIVSDLVSGVNASISTEKSRLAYYRLFDESIVGVLPESPKRQMLDRFIAAEASFLQTQNEKTVEGLVNGEFGRSMRTRISAEREFEKKRAAADKKAAIGVLFMGLGGLASGGVMMGPMQTMQMTQQIQDAMDKIHVAHQSGLGGVSSEQGAAIVNIQQTVEAIQASSLAELRSKLKSIYKRTFP